MDVMIHHQQSSNDQQALEESMPLAMMILIPILSSGFILLILAVVCIRRQTKASAASSLTASPLVKMTSTNTASAGTVAASNEAMARGVVSTSSSDHQANTTLQTLKRLSSLHFYAKPWAPTTAPSSLTYNDNLGGQHDPEEQPDDDEVESW